MNSKPTTAWMWQEGFHTRGAMLEVGSGIIEWQMDTPCNCSAETVKQPVADFLAHGADRYLVVPDDILAEIRQSLAQLASNRPKP